MGEKRWGRRREWRRKEKLDKKVKAVYEEQAERNEEVKVIRQV